ncbi:hypothetical protein HPB49_005115 [Dermacentor silvarum]|uniref:Uncharacterized protein n=1 Tax=Dermacentor silvarum TaxID=543639 RepID=A0ACB8DVG7_DERSI|nr:hypothetical protein HPB49_005115 [Dermacentor silvarum]
MADLRIEEPKQRARVHAQVPVLRRGAPHGRPNVQGKIQVAAHSEAEKLAGEKQSRKGTHIGRRKDDPSADHISPSGYSMAEGKGQSRSRSRSLSPIRRRSRSHNRHTDRAAQSHLVRHSRGEKWILCREHPRHWQMEKMERENKELREELGRARKQNEQSARQIDELQQTLNEILKNMRGSSHEWISSSTSREAAERGNVTATEGEVGEMDTCCGEEAPATAGSKRKGTIDAPPTEDTYAAVNTQLAAMNKRIEDLEPVNVPAILTSDNNANTTRTGEGEMHGQLSPGLCYVLYPYECMGRDVRVCTLVKRGTAFIEHELVLHEESDIDHVLIEVVPSSGRKKTGLFVLNVIPKEGRDRSRGAVDDDAPQPSRVDNRLAHLLAAKKSMQRRAKWQELCDTMNGNMSAGRTWKILRHLLDPGSTRTATRTEMAKLRHKYKDDPEAFAEEIVQTHLARPEGKSHPERLSTLQRGNASSEAERMRRASESADAR